LLFFTLGCDLTNAQTTAPAASCQCPETIEVNEAAAQPQGWSATGGRVKRRFERISIYNGKRGRKEFELAPSTEDKRGKVVNQSWRLKGYRDMNVFLRCRYRGTPVTLETDIPSSFESCTFTFEIDDKGKIQGRPTMACR